VSERQHFAALGVLNRDICQCRKGLLPALKPEYADVLGRVDLGAELPDQVAKKVGIILNKLQVRLHCARQALKISLERTGGKCVAHGL
jgi:DNA-directed RNA polymerase specialized sigma24 family protein